MTYSKNIFVGFAIFVAFFISAFTYPLQARAIGAITLDPTNLIQNTTSAIKDIDMKLKEFVLDGLVNSVAKATAAKMTESIVNWINTGFEGNPSFITDIESHLLDIADEVAADFIERLDFDTQSYICSPFSADIKYALTIEYYSKKKGKNRCSLEDIFANAEKMDKFLDGAFSEGGWKGWFSVAVVPSNNVYGSFLKTRSDMYQEINDAETRTIKEVDWGQGFLSSKDCETLSDKEAYMKTFTRVGDRNPGTDITELTEKVNGKNVKKICAIKTPGKVIEGQLANQLGSGIRQLELADEIDEIVGALVAQLAKQVLTGVGGLVGVSAKSSNGSTYLGDATLEQRGITDQIAETGAQERIAQSIDTENSYYSVKGDAFGSIISADNALKPLEICLAANSSSNPILTNAFAFASSARSSINTASSTTAADLKTSDLAFVTLAQLETDAQTAETGESIDSIIRTLENLIRSNAIHDGRDLVAATREGPALITKMQTIVSDSSNHRALCGL